MIGHLLVRGHRLECAVWEPADVSHATPALVLLHEGLGSVTAWRSFPAELAARTGWRVFAYSRAGYGASDPVALPRPTRFMHDEAIDELPHVLDALGLARPVIIGHSDGGSIALIFGAHHPERVRALIVEAPHVFVEDVSVASIARMKTAYETTDLRARLARFHGNNVDVAFRGWNDVWLSPEFRGWNIEAALPQIACPLLVLQGEDDQYGTLAQVDAIASQAGGPTRTVILPSCGHAPHHDQRRSVLDEVDRFLSALPI